MNGGEGDWPFSLLSASLDCCSAFLESALGWAHLERRHSEDQTEPVHQHVAALYDELRALAKHYMERTPPGRTLQPTALVHETFAKLARSPLEQCSREEFFAYAAAAMRDVLVDDTRRRLRLKRGGDHDRKPFPLEAIVDHRDDPSGQEVSEEDRVVIAIDRFAEAEPRKAHVVVLRVYLGMTHEQIAFALGLSVPTVERDWRFARAWLYRELGDGPWSLEGSTESLGDG